MHMKTAIEAGQCIREARQAQGLTQAELADLLEVSRQWVIRTERGNDSAEFSLVMKAFGVLNIDLVASHGTDLEDYHQRGHTGSSEEIDLFEESSRSEVECHESDSKTTEAYLAEDGGDQYADDILAMRNSLRSTDE